MAKIVNIEDRVFGELLVLHKTSMRKNKGVVWACLCSCGVGALVETSELRSGKIISCGCCYGDYRIGDRFGLLVVEVFYKQKGIMLAHCKCDCGGSKTTKLWMLVNKKVSSCGCRLAWNKNDVSGDRFGRLVAIKENGKRFSNNVGWLCLCDCGKKVVVPVNSLKAGVTKSCGCLRGDIAREKLQDETVKAAARAATSERMRSDDGAYQIAKMHMTNHSALGVENVPDILVETQALRILINREIRRITGGKY